MYILFASITRTSLSKRAKNPTTLEFRAFGPYETRSKAVTAKNRAYRKAAESYSGVRINWTEVRKLEEM